jgi:hypothetical protein
MEENITISLRDLKIFLELLEGYGRYRTYPSIENAGTNLYFMFFGDDEFAKEDFKEWAKGQVNYVNG